jgi:anti-sigma factor RsiW
MGSTKALVGRSVHLAVDAIGDRLCGGRLLVASGFGWTRVSYQRLLVLGGDALGR